MPCQGLCSALSVVCHLLRSVSNNQNLRSREPEENSLERPAASLEERENRWRQEMNSFSLKATHVPLNLNHPLTPGPVDRAEKSSDWVRAKGHLPSTKPTLRVHLVLVQRGKAFSPLLEPHPLAVFVHLPQHVSTATPAFQD